MGRVVSLAVLKNKIKTLRSKGKTIAFTNGCFDIIHPGHLKILKEAKQGADILIVGINSDSSVKKLKGKTRPVLPAKSRAKIVASIKEVDFAVIFRETTPLKLIEAVKPDILAKGADWKRGDIIGSSVIKKRGGKVKRIKLVKSFSTTKIINSILKKYGCKQ